MSQATMERSQAGQAWREPPLPADARELRRMVAAPFVAACAILAARVALEYVVLRPGRAFWLDVVASAAGITALVAISLVQLRRVVSTVEQARSSDAGHVHQLEALSAAALALTSDLDTTSVLQKVVDLSRRVLGTRYGALAVLGPGGTIEQFLSSGIDPLIRAKLGPPPTGHGVLGVVIEDRQPLRTENIQGHPRSVGFPEGHPPMKTLLAVPITYEGEVIGSLYVSERDDAQAFTSEDQETLVRFAAHAAVAVVNSRLYQQVRRLSALDERQRIAMDLHDGVLQSIFGVSLTLETCATHFEADPTAARREIEQSLDSLAGSARDIRSYVRDLRQSEHGRESLAALMQRLVDSVEAGPDVRKALIVRGDLADVPQECQWALWHVVHEALSNAVRHGHADRIDVHLVRVSGTVRCAVQDNGAGFETTADVGETHNGLSNMRWRIQSLGGRWTVLSAPGRGTTVIAEVPLAS